MTEKEHYP